MTFGFVFCILCQILLILLHSTAAAAVLLTIIPTIVYSNTELHGANLTQTKKKELKTLLLPNLLTSFQSHTAEVPKLGGVPSYGAQCHCMLGTDGINPKT